MNPALDQGFSGGVRIVRGGDGELHTGHWKSWAWTLVRNSDLIHWSTPRPLDPDLRLALVSV